MRYELGAELYDAINSLKVQKIIRRFGISIYTPVELDGIIGIFDIDVVQAPLNVLTAEFLESLIS